MPSTSAVVGVRVVGPLAVYAPGFAEELRGRGYTELSVAGQLRLMAHASRWLASVGLDASGSVRSRWPPSAATGGRRATGGCAPCGRWVRWWSC